MNRSGFSLLEVLTAVAIAGIIAGLGTVSFVGWRAKHEIDNEIRQAYVDLMNVRMMAVGKNMAHFVSLGANQMRVYQDSNGNGTLNTASDGILCLWDKPTAQVADGLCPNSQSTSVKNFPRPVRWGGDSTIRFDSRGLSAGDQTVCIDYSLTPQTSPSYDCVDLSRTRVSVGKLADPLGACNSANCQTKK